MLITLSEVNHYLNVIKMGHLQTVDLFQLQASPVDCSIWSDVEWSWRGKTFNGHFPHKHSAVILLMLMEVMPPYYILKTFYQSFKILNYVTWQLGNVTYKQMETESKPDCSHLCLKKKKVYFHFQLASASDELLFLAKYSKI